MQVNEPRSEEDQPESSAHVEEGFLQAERGELIDGDQARREIQTMKECWRRTAHRLG